MLQYLFECNFRDLGFYLTGLSGFPHWTLKKAAPRFYNHCYPTRSSRRVKARCTITKNMATNICKKAPTS